MLPTYMHILTAMGVTVMQGYSYVQRPALTSAAVAIAGPDNTHQLQHGNDEKHVPAARAASCAAVSGMPVGPGGRERKSTFPAFPQVSLLPA